MRVALARRARGAIGVHDDERGRARAVVRECARASPGSGAARCDARMGWGDETSSSVKMCQLVSFEPRYGTRDEGRDVARSR